MIPYERLCGVFVKTRIIPQAEKILSEGWGLCNYEKLNIKQNIPWHLENQEQRSHNYHIQSLDMIDPLLRAYSQLQDSKYLESALTVSMNWIYRHSVSEEPSLSPFVWHDMSVGKRAYRLAYLYEAAEAAGKLDKEACQLLWSSLEQHAAYLADDANMAFHNNHGYYQVAGQLAMGRRFAGKSSIMAQAKEQGRERLQRMLKQQFASDGVHREHSPDYHRMVYDTLTELIDSALVEDAETIAFARRIEEALAWFVFPNQHIVNFGDSDDRLLKDADAKWVIPEMRFWVSGGKIGEPSRETVRAFWEGGYWVARKAGDDPQELDAYSYLALNAAFHSRTHKHADDLSFVWFDRGHNLLVDAGRYGYIGKTEQGSELWLDGHWYSDPWRVYCESTRAHNTLEFDGRNFPRKGVKPYGSALRRCGTHDSGMMFVETECKHFVSIRHARMLFFMPGRWLVVFDWFHDNAGALHAVKQWFHIGHELQLFTDRGCYQVVIPGSLPLRISSLLSGSIVSRPYIGEEDSVIQGWWSPKGHDVVPNYAFCYELPEASSGAFATLFSFSRELGADVEWSKVNVSGCRGQFRWKDESGVHELRFERPGEGDLSVDYRVRKSEL